jgi:hypothetical protein
VIVAEWHIVQGGTVTRILLPPAAINAIRAPEATEVERDECAFNSRFQNDQGG